MRLRDYLWLSGTHSLRDPQHPGKVEVDFIHAQEYVKFSLYLPPVSPSTQGR